MPFPKIEPYKIAELTERYYGSDPIQLERELRQIAAPYLDLMNDIYSTSTFSVIVSRNSTELSKTIYPVETEDRAAEVRHLMTKALSDYLVMRQKVQGQFFGIPIRR